MFSTTGQTVEGVDGLFVVDHVILDAADAVQECVLRAGRGIVQTAGHRVNRRGIAVFVLEHDAVKAVHDPLGAVLQACRMIAKGGASAKGLHAVNIHGIVQKSRKKSRRI